MWRMMGGIRWGRSEWTTRVCGLQWRPDSEGTDAGKEDGHVMYCYGLEGLIGDFRFTALLAAHVKCEGFT